MVMISTMTDVGYYDDYDNGYDNGCNDGHDGNLNPYGPFDDIIVNSIVVVKIEIIIRDNKVLIYTPCPPLCRVWYCYFSIIPYLRANI